jgi:hypothetical protein
MSDQTMIFGWTLQQFEVAAIQYRAINSGLPAPDHKGLSLVRAHWMSKNRPLPQKHLIVLESPDGWLTWTAPYEIQQWVGDAFVNLASLTPPKAVPKAA